MVKHLTILEIEGFLDFAVPCVPPLSDLSLGSSTRVFVLELGASCSHSRDRGCHSQISVWPPPVNYRGEKKHISTVKLQGTCNITAQILHESVRQWLGHQQWLPAPMASQFLDRNLIERYTNVVMKVRRSRFIFVRTGVVPCHSQSKNH